MAAKKKLESRGICPICTEEKILTRDHVPPKAIFLKPRPANTVTVFTCEDCNEGSKLDDEYFRLYIGTTNDPDSHLMKLWRQKVVGSSFKRSPALRAALVEGMDRAKEHHKADSIMTFDGRPLTDEEVENILPLDKARIDRVVSKIVRCLHFHHEGTPLPKESALEVTVDPLQKPEMETVIRNRTGMVGCGFR